MDAESLRSIVWHCSPEQLAHIEDETLVGSDRNLEWYTWHLWKRLLKADFGDGGLQAPELESEQPVDYVHPRGIADEPGDYRTLYMHRKAEMEERTAAAKERIAAAQQQVQDAKESRKAKMIDKLVPTKRRCSGSSSRGQTSSLTSAYLHKPRADSRSSVMGKPGGQLKLLSELGLVKKAPPRSTTTVRVIKPSPVPSAAMGHSSSLAGAQLLSKATGGQLGKTSVGSGRSLHVTPQQPQVAARAAAVAAAAAVRATPSASNPGDGISPRSGSTSSVGRPSPPAPHSGSKRLADGVPAAQPPPSKMAAIAAGSSCSLGSKGGPGPSKPDPRVMFPRQVPPTSASGQSKFAVPTARPTTTSGLLPGAARQRPPVAGDLSVQQGALGARPSDDL
ncbi:hypothetical protein VOLCADRAFT_86485 [Volvox carteri f. nagariensis]|uniref:Uncharacterized protein n=1 Tax=Volvox carteri f. nagariensis TaxID=3068 RepID=D8TGU5_VOLCA|nr:uncharacterized protein VOLCADRAFT_86485 [Volvox carteri f. nagariensis]EFJ52961.1 hypothetical protein VOLCADRAFT_86485 [Volvox carteri f. nagariensis]|eukprot:XP_002945966.1 hypothetical protein VOLCADRAFT_86485 [Volvox carteri f. nagariensis]